MTPTDSLKEQLVLVRGKVAREDDLSIPPEQSLSTCISHEPAKFEIIDLYSVGHEQKKKDTLPFIHLLSLEGPKGEAVRIRGLFDDGALVNVMCSTIFDKVKRRLGLGVTSKRQLQMANGTVIPSKAHWEGHVNLGGICAKIAFEVFDSGGNWPFLFGKPALETFNAIHNYGNDTVFITGIGGSTTIRNQAQHPHYARIAKVAGVNLALDIKQYEPEWIKYEADTIETTNETANKTGVANSANEGKRRQREPKSVKRARQRQQRKVVVLATTPKAWLIGGRRWMMKQPKTTRLKRGGPQTSKEVPQHTNNNQSDAPPSKAQPTDQEPTTPVCIVTNDEHIQVPEPGTEIPTEGFDVNESLYTRHTDAFKPARVQAVLDMVTLGPDLTDDEREKATDLIREFADCFALAVSEVTQVPGVVHRLNVPNDAKFSSKINQRPLTPPQRQYLNKKIDEMLEAGVIEQVEPSQVKCISPTVLSQKAHEGGGLTLEELQQRINTECTKAGLEPHFDLPEIEQVPDFPEPSLKEQKWRICQNFAEVNRITEIAAMPQGDIRLKQQKLSGHRFVSVFDFASGFYAVKIHEESRPYIAFYVEGRGYFWYAKMPFGLTGAPSTFAHMTATHLHDLLTDEVMELFVDDGGAAADSFDDMVAKLRRILTRVRERKLSLSAAKSQFFMTEAVFAGGRVGPKGVLPDLTKLTAIVDWDKPQDALNLASFLGLTGHFRDLVKDYARLEQPLRDLIRNVDLPPNYSKTIYRKIMAGYKLKSIWNAEHDKAFVRLKAVITTEPVLKGPKWDGTPFVVTTDGCKDGFAGVLAQRFKTTLPSGRVVEKLHPIAFASKRTSRAEEKYKPFLLEFAALKFALDKFSNIIWGFPVEIETDCQALRDVMLNDKLNAAHARWRDGILAQQIVDVRHVPGKINVVADGISWKWEGLPRQVGDGSEWTVCEDWEATTGLVNDILHVTLEGDIRALKDRFKDEPVFKEVLDAMLAINSNCSVRDRRRAQHRASQYLIKDGKLWRLKGGTAVRARAHVECVTKAEAKAMAFQHHSSQGHWGRDAIKIALMDRIWCPGLDAMILDAIKDCAKCKNFGTTFVHSLFEPITHRHPFELLVGDYLSLPTGRGGFKTIGVFLDVYSQHIWVFIFKTAGSAKTTISALQQIFRNFVTPETFMSDGGSHFKNAEVRDFCTLWKCAQHVVSAYSPWINGLVEGTNKILLHVLKRLCAPDLGEDEYAEMDWDTLPKTWPLHIDNAVLALNTRILPALKFTSKELLLGLVVNTPPTPLSISSAELLPTEVETQMAYVAQQRLDRYESIVRHAVSRKSAFDRRMLAKKPGQVVFKRGQLVQIYRSDLDYTFKTERKLLPKWSQPRRIAKQLRNSYKLENLDGSAIEGTFSSRRLREFIPREGTQLAKAQWELEERLAEAGESTESGAEDDEDEEEETDNTVEEVEEEMEGEEVEEEED